MANLSTIKSAFCYFFVYYGTCSFGQSCKFTHPDPDDDQFDWEAMIQSWYAYHTRKIPCKFFCLGVCKYGVSCRFDHSVPIYVPNPWYHFNALGLPKRWGEPDCFFYMCTGYCGYGLGCKFHHPEPVFYYPYQEYGSYAGDEAVLYEPKMTQGLGVKDVGEEAVFYDPNQEYDLYVGGNAVEYQNGCLGINDGWNGELFYVKEPHVTLNNVGLPLRPGKKVCRFYMNFYRCKYGRWCKFDHPQKRPSNEEGSSSVTQQ